MPNTRVSVSDYKQDQASVKASSNGLLPVSIFMGVALVTTLGLSWYHDWKLKRNFQRYVDAARREGPKPTPPRRKNLIAATRTSL